MARLYADENFPHPVVAALPGVFTAALQQEPRFTRALGEAYDVITARGALAAVAAATASGAGAVKA